MKRISVGDAVSFLTATGRPAQGCVVQLITERRQPTMVLIERPDGGRAIRLENEIELLDDDDHEPLAASARPAPARAAG